jgi:hypothetical protein
MRKISNQAANEANAAFCDCISNDGRCDAEVLDHRPKVFLAFSVVDDNEVYSLIWILLLLFIAEDGTDSTSFGLWN